MTPRTVQGSAARPRSGLLVLLRTAALRRLIGVRVLGQFGDGAFQGALAGSILFDPQRSASSAELALGFAVLLVPYSLLGPFVGSLLDRWSRRQVLVWANVIRCFFVALVAIEIATGAPLVLQTGTALFVLGAGRFIGSGLSAAMPHTVRTPQLVGANALATTVGAICTGFGGATALGVLSLVGESRGTIATLTAAVVLCYAASALVALGFSRSALGPDHTDEPAETIRAVLGGFSDGWRHLVQRPTIGTAITMVALVRFCFGATTVLLILLFASGHLGGQGFIRSGPAGIAEALGASSLGLFAGALVTAPGVRWLGRTRWLVVVLSGAALTAFLCAALLSAPMVLAAAFLLALAYQSSKICADSVVQADSDDAHIGRVFALYDTGNNLFYVAGIVTCALLVPPNGDSPAMAAAVGVVYLLAASVYPVAMRRSARITGLAREHAVH